MKKYLISIILIFILNSLVSAQPAYEYSFKQDLPLGNSIVLEINGNELYFAKGNALYILDITYPENLSLSHEMIMEFAPSDIMVENNTLFVAMDRLGVYIYDVTIPESPLFLGIYLADHLYQRMAIAGDELYLIHSDGLEVVDVSDPRTPNLMRLMEMRTMPNAIEVYDDYLLVSTFDELAIIDVHTPEFPSMVYELDMPFGSDILVEDNIALVSTTNALFSIDLSDAYFPRIVSQVKDHFQISQMDAENKRIYGCSNSGFLTIMTMDEGDIQMLNGKKFDANFKDILVRNNYAYVLNKKGGLDVFNVSDEFNIEKVGHFDETFYPQVYFIF